MNPLIACTVLCLALAAGPAVGASPGDKDAIAMTERAAALIKAKGKREMVKRILARDPEFYQEAMYLDMRDLYTGIVLAHPINPAMMGTDKSAAVGPQAGQYPRQVIELAQRSGKGWVDYQYRHPASGAIEAKSSYVLRVDDVVLEAGILKQ
ncbi:MAG: cache domain-containing protein [Bdellovibrionales bacterium]|nr:cache domain-containing protein [Massilia sp.]